MAKYELDMERTGIQMMIDEARSLGACEDGLRWAERKERQTHTFEDFITEMVVDSSFRMIWRVWMVANLKHNASEGIKDIWFDAIRKGTRIIQKHHANDFSAAEIKRIQGEK